MYQHRDMDAQRAAGSSLSRVMRSSLQLIISETVFGLSFLFSFCRETSFGPTYPKNEGVKRFHEPFQPAIDDILNHPHGRVISFISGIERMHKSSTTLDFDHDRTGTSPSTMYGDDKSSHVKLFS